MSIHTVPTLDDRRRAARAANCVRMPVMHELPESYRHTCGTMPREIFTQVSGGYGSHQAVCEQCKTHYGLDWWAVTR